MYTGSLVWIKLNKIPILWLPDSATHFNIIDIHQFQLLKNDLPNLQLTITNIFLNTPTTPIHFEGYFHAVLTTDLNSISQPIYVTNITVPNPIICPASFTALFQ